MARREYAIRLHCAEPGCGKGSTAIAETRKEEAKTRARYAQRPYRCYRHSKPSEVLAADNRERRAVLTAHEVRRTDRGEEYILGVFWGETAETAHSGSVHGPGFRAICKDFPAGTKLIVTARIELPDDGCDE